MKSENLTEKVISELKKRYNENYQFDVEVIVDTILITQKLIEEKPLLTAEQQTEIEKLDSEVSIITKFVLVNQILLNLSHRLTQSQYYEKEIRKYLNLLMPHLIKKEKDFDMFFDKSDKATKEVYDVYNHCLNVYSQFNIPEYTEINNILLAYQKDKKSIIGIANKILK
jgi:hypothetical protein